MKYYYLRLLPRIREITLMYICVKFEVKIDNAFVVRFFRTKLGTRSGPGDLRKGSLFISCFTSEGVVYLIGSSTVEAQSVLVSITSPILSAVSHVVRRESLFEKISQDIAFVNVTLKNMVVLS